MKNLLLTAFTGMLLSACIPSSSISPTQRDFEGINNGLWIAHIKLTQTNQKSADKLAYYTCGKQDFKLPLFIENGDLSVQFSEHYKTHTPINPEGYFYTRFKSEQNTNYSDDMKSYFPYIDFPEKFTFVIRGQLNATEGTGEGQFIIEMGRLNEGCVASFNAIKKTRNKEPIHKANT